MASPAELVIAGTTTSPLEMLVLKEQVGQLEKRVASLENRLRRLADDENEEEVVTLREVPREQAKEEIQKLYARGETLFMSEVAERLSLPDALVVELCLELMKEGEIRVNEERSRSEN
jgi:hypothetical protein